MGAVATLLGVGGGALITGSRLKDDIVKRLEEETSLSRTTADRRSAQADDSGGGVGDPTAVQASADLSANQPATEAAAGSGQAPGQPAVEEDTASGGQEFGQPVGEEGGRQELSRPAPGGASPELPPSSAVLGTASELTVRGDSGEESDGGIDPEASRQLAKIFAAMRPEDAAAVLQGMENPEVQAILLRMGERQAAAILGDFAPDRAAALSQLVLSNPVNGS